MLYHINILNNLIFSDDSLVCAFQPNKIYKKIPFFYE